MDLFTQVTTSNVPLAEKLRPKKLEDLFLGVNDDLTKLYKSWGKPVRSSFMLYGPAGSGKTSFIKLLFDEHEGPREQVNAVDVGIPKLRIILKSAEDTFRIQGAPTLVFLDEAHRLKAPQQDIFLPAVEAGSVVLMAATTENPSFRFNRAFLSRLRLIPMAPLSDVDLEALVDKGLNEAAPDLDLPANIRTALITRSGGDARRLFGDLQSLIGLFVSEGKLDEASALDYLNLDIQSGSEDLKINALSALIKSMRASDEKASVYYMGLLLKAKEDPEVLLRRMLVFTSEDIGNANPQAVVFINSIWEVFLKVGMPEGLYSLYHACAYLAKSPKSRRHVEQMKWVSDQMDFALDNIVIPAHLRNHPKEKRDGASNLPEHMSGK